MALAACAGPSSPPAGGATESREEAVAYTPPPAGTPPGDWLVWGDTSEPATLNCVRAADRSEQRICRLVADSLVDFGPERRVIPRLAASFSLSSDRRVLTFRLRRGVRWHDGRPFTAADVLHTVALVRRIDPTGRRFEATFGTLTRVDAPDDHTITAVYDSALANALVGWRSTFIVPAHVPMDARGRSPLDREPIGTGPFRFGRWDGQTQIVLEANRDYFGGRPLVDRFVLRIVAKQEGMRAAVEAGELDVASLSTDWYAANHAPPAGRPFRVLTLPTSSMQMIYWNLEEPRGLFRDPRVRRALTMLLDRDGYATKVQQGVYRPAVTLIDPILWGGDPGLRAHPFDPGRAARLLDEAGIVDRDGDGVRDTASGPMAFTLTYHGGTTGHPEIGEMLERAATGAGVRVALQALEWPVLRRRAYAGEFEACLYRWSLEDLPDPYRYFHSSQIGGAGYNFGRYRSEAFDGLSEEFHVTFDERRRTAILVELQRILHEDQPCTFVAIAGVVWAIHKRFRTPPVPEAGLWDWYPSLLLWWVPPSERRYH